MKNLTTIGFKSIWKMQIMETLKVEMDALRDFETLLVEGDGPSEEEVLQYFESVQICKGPTVARLADTCP